MASNFTWIDATIIVVYVLVLVGIGVHFARSQKKLDEFFLAGQRFGWLPVGLSLLCALHSGIAYLMGPSTAILYGLIFSCSIFTWLFLYPWAAYVTLPFYRKLNMFTAYEYLERRFSIWVRSLAAMLFLLWRLGWMATSIYVPCLTISVVSGGRISWMSAAITMGLLVTFYTMLGGIKAVIWTDCLQFFIMIMGVTATIVVIVYNVPGGLASVWAIASAAGKTSLSYATPGIAHANWWEATKLFFADPRTVSGIIISGVVGRMTSYAGDQVMVQRFQTTKSLRDSRQAFVISAISDVGWTLGLAFVGLALFAYYKGHTLPAGMKADKIFPYFITHVFPTGVIGLVVAAILGASLAALSSAINACTSVIMIDFYHRLVHGKQMRRDDPSLKQDGREVRRARIISIIVGIVGTAVSTQLGQLGNLIEIANKVIQIFTGPLLGIYVLGMFSRRASSKGVLVGGAVGAFVAVYITFASPIAFIWPTVFGLGVTLVLGYAVSLLFPQRGRDVEKLMWAYVVRGNDPQSSGIRQHYEKEEEWAESAPAVQKS